MKRRAAYVALLLTADVALLGVFTLLIEIMRIGPWFAPAVGEALDTLLPNATVPSLGFPLAVVFSLAMLGAYGALDPREAVVRRLVAAGLAVTLPAWPALWKGGSPLLAASYVTLAGLLALCLVTAFRLSEFVRRIMTPRRLRAAAVLLVAGEHDLKRAFRHPAVSDRGLFSIRSVLDPAELNIRGALEGVCHAIRRCNADTIVLCCGPLSDRAFSVVVDAATSMGCGLVSLARAARGSWPRPRMIRSHGGSLMILATPGSRAVPLLVKRAADLVGALVGLALALPLLVLAAVAIKLDSRGPVLFGHLRVGAWGTRFRCLKFRTMRMDAEKLLRDDPALYEEYVRNSFKLPEGKDPRITRVGRLLRKTSLDELPQLWNVLRGEMSLIGPRPLVPDELNEYGQKRRVLLSVKPGMSGAWAVLGRSRVGYPRRAAIELRYVRRWGLRGDLSILWRTVPAVIARRGAH